MAFRQLLRMNVSFIGLSRHNEFCEDKTQPIQSDFDKAVKKMLTEEEIGN